MDLERRRRRIRGVGAGVALLATCGTIVATVYAVTLIKAGVSGMIAAGFTVLIAGVVLVAVGAGWVAWKNPGNPQALTVSRVAVHALAALGGLVLAGLAALILFFAACFAIAVLA